MLLLPHQAARETFNRLMRIETRGPTNSRLSLLRDPTSNRSPLLLPRVSLLPEEAEEGRGGVVHDPVLPDKVPRVLLGSRGGGGMVSVDQSLEQMIDRHQHKTVYTLLALLERRDAIRLSYDELLRTFRDRARPLVEVVQENRGVIERVIEQYCTRLLLKLLLLDKSALRLSEFVERIERLYEREPPPPPPPSSQNKNNSQEPPRSERIIDRVKNDFVYYDAVNAMINARCTQGGDMTTDELYNSNSVARKRGRKKKQKEGDAVEPVPDALEHIMASLIQNGKKSIAAASGGSKSSPVVDLYPAYKRCLEVLNESIPKRDNHGLLLEHLIQSMRRLSVDDGVPSELLCVINNAQYCTAARPVRLSFDPERERFYCCVTGEALENGEEVNWLQFVERDARRGGDDDRASGLDVIGRPFEQEEFTRSIKSFLFKRVIDDAPVSIFRQKREEDDDAPPRPIKRKVSVSPEKKKKPRVERSCDRLWREMCALTHWLDAPERQSRVTNASGVRHYATECGQLNKVFGLMDEANFVALFDRLLSFYLGEQQQQEAMQKLKCRLVESVLDLLDALQLDPLVEQESVVLRRLLLLALKRRRYRAELPAAGYFYNPFTLFAPEETGLFREYLFFFIIIFSQCVDVRRTERQMPTEWRYDHRDADEEVMARFGLSLLGVVDDAQ